MPKSKQTFPPVAEFAPIRRKLPRRARFSRGVKSREIIEVSIYFKPLQTDRAASLGSTSAWIGRDDLHALREQQYATHVRLLKKFARTVGLKVIAVHPGRRLVHLSGSAAKVQKAFRVRLGIYREGGQEYRSWKGKLHLPKDLHVIVESVLGLDTRPVVRRQVTPVIPAAQVGGANGYLPNKVGQMYGFPSNVNGSGQCIAIIECGGGYLNTDLQQAFAAMNLPVPTIKPALVDGAPSGENALTNTDADFEVALDVQVAGGLAPGASLVVYFTTNSEKGIADALSKAISDPIYKPSIISMSFGDTETNWNETLRLSIDSQLLDAAQNHGISVFVPSGDYLATNGERSGTHVQFPASSCGAIGCGGTKIATDGNKITSEVVWNQGFTGTGGGISSIYTNIPSFQKDANLPLSVDGGSAGRGVPDVAAHASPGYSIFVNGKTVIRGGTSAAVPLWAALTALINQAVGRQIGFFLNEIYLNPTLLQVVTSGNNIPTGSTIGYSATKGWSACTGLGVPDGAKLTTYFKTQIAPPD